MKTILSALFFFVLSIAGSLISAAPEEKTVCGLHEQGGMQLTRCYKEGDFSKLQYFYLYKPGLLPFDTRNTYGKFKTDIIEQLESAYQFETLRALHKGIRDIVVPADEAAKNDPDKSQTRRIQNEIQVTIAWGKAILAADFFPERD